MLLSRLKSFFFRSIQSTSNIWHHNSYSQVDYLIDQLRDRLRLTPESSSEHIDYFIQQLHDQFNFTPEACSGHIDYFIGQLRDKLNLTPESAGRYINYFINQLKQDILLSSDFNFRAPKVDKYPIQLTPLQKDEKIRIVFPVFNPQQWVQATSLIYSECTNNEKIAPLVVQCTYRGGDRNLALSYIDILNECLLESNIPFIPVSAYNIVAHKPHVVFYNSPYPEFYDECFAPSNFSRYGFRIAYLPYATPLYDEAISAYYHHDLYIYRMARFVFAQNDDDKRYFGKYCLSGNTQVYVTGNPKLDRYHHETPTPDDLRKKINNKKVFLWNPLYVRTADNFTWPCFLHSYRQLIHFVNSRDDIFLICRPHTLLFSTILSSGQFSETDIEEVKHELRNSPNTYLDENIDFFTCFNASDALISPESSLIYKFFPSKKPILLQERPTRTRLTKTGRIFDYCYKTNDTEGIYDFINMVAVNNSDELYAAREQYIAENYTLNDGKAAKRIVDTMIAEMYANDTFYTKYPEDTISDSFFWEKLDYSITEDDALRKWKCDIINRTIAHAKPMRILDIGCGLGFFSEQFARNNNIVDAIDINPYLLNIARTSQKEKGLENITYHNLSIQNYTLIDNFDLVCFMDVSRYILDNFALVRIFDLIAASLYTDSLLLFSDVVSPLTTLSKEIYGHDECDVVYRNEHPIIDALKRRGFELISKGEVVRETNGIKRSNMFMILKKIS